MQDPDDGGVYHKLTDLIFDGMQLPHHSKTERYVVMKTTAAALDFAAVMARANRVFKAFRARPGLSNRPSRPRRTHGPGPKAHRCTLPPAGRRAHRRLWRRKSCARVRLGGSWAVRQHRRCGYLPCLAACVPKLTVPSWTKWAHSAG